jgi:hypothetical protein
MLSMQVHFLATPPQCLAKITGGTQNKAEICNYSYEVQKYNWSLLLL